MTEYRTPIEAAAPKNLGQCKIAAARTKRFWCVCSNAFLAIHLVALLIDGFMVADGRVFRLVAGVIGSDAREVA